MSAIEPQVRFWTKVEFTESCWLWTGLTDPAGYGRFRHTTSKRDASALAHRFAYEFCGGSIPVGMVIDHLCRVRRCVKPEHMEVVTRGENSRRGMHPKMVTFRTGVCSRGHAIIGRNAAPTSTGRPTCRECKNENQRRHRRGVGTMAKEVRA